MGIVFSTPSIVVNNSKENDILQTKLEKYIQNILDKTPLIVDHDDFLEKTRKTLYKDILSKIPKYELDAIGQKCNIKIDNNIHNSKEEYCKSLSEYYLKKVQLAITIKSILNYLVDEVANTNTDGTIRQLRSVNNCVETINELNGLFKNLYTEEQMTIYKDNISIRQKVINDIPISMDKLLFIETELMNIIKRCKNKK